MDAEMWYPNKSQWWVIWIVFVVASLLFVSSPYHNYPGSWRALAFCVLVFGGLLVS
jgi:lipoprotein signal peptidase